MRGSPTTHRSRDRHLPTPQQPRSPPPWGSMLGPQSPTLAEVETLEELAAFIEKQVCAVGSFVHAQEDGWARANHHLYNVDGTVGGTPATAPVAHGFGPPELHHKKSTARAAVCSSAATKQLISIYYDAGHVQPGLWVNAVATEHHPAKSGVTLPALANVWAAP